MDKKELFLVPYSHLDTQWRWDYPTTIKWLIRRTMRKNFRLFKKYPHYVFNFTGSRRYSLMKEYYPEDYKKVQEYVNEFLEKYDRLNSGMPIGGFVETAIYVDMIQKIKKERETK